MVTIDGEDVVDITIDGDPVQEVTIDGDLAWTAYESTVPSSENLYTAKRLDLADQDPVDPWPDLDGTADASAGDAPTYETGAINGRPAVKFDGTANQLDTGRVSDTTQAQSLFAVVKWTGTAGDNVFYGTYDDSGTVDRWYSGESSGEHVAGAGDTRATGGSFPSDPTIVSVIADGSTAEIYENGGLVRSFSYSGVNDMSATHLLGALGTPSGPINYFDGYIGEIVKAGSLTESEHEAELQRLSTEWGIALTDVVIYESFESGDLTAYSGGTADHSVTSAASSEGTYSLTTGSANYDPIYRDSSSQDDPQRGETFKFHHWNGEIGDGRTRFWFAESASNFDSSGYRLQINFSGSTANRLYDTNGNTILFDADWQIQRSNMANQWNTVVVDFGDTSSDTIAVEYRDPDGNVAWSGSVVDTTYDSGIIGWAQYNHADQYVDNLHTTTTVLEDFESTNIGTDYSGSTNRFATTTAWAYSGSNSLTPTDSSHGDIAPASGGTISRGDRLVCRGRFGTSGTYRLMFCWAVQDRANAFDACYLVRFRQDQGKVQFMALQNASGTVLDSFNYTASTNTTYRWDVNYGSSTISIDVVNEDTGSTVGTLSASDSTWGSGPFGFVNSGNTDEYWDYVTLGGP